ncbi:MAG: hypothetical protein V1746_05440 [bacterium]
MKTASWTDALEERLGHWAIPHITRGIVALNALVFVLNLINPEFVRDLALDPSAVARGEVWRLASFLFIPDTRNILFLVLYLLFTWFVGEALESEWGAFKLNLYFLTGMIGTAIAAFAFVKGQVDNFYLHASLLLAFGTVFPRMELMLFPLPIPIQARFLAMFSGLLLVLAAVFAPFAVAAALLNYILFFLPPVVEAWREQRKSAKRMKAFRDRDNR